MTCRCLVAWCVCVWPSIACSEGRGPVARVPEVDTLANGARVVTHVAPERTATAILESRIGSVGGESPDVFGRVGGLGLDSLERVFVLDELAREVRVFDRHGNFLRRFAARGQGPGELESASGLLVDRGGSSILRDLSLWRYSRFDPSGHFQVLKRMPAGSGVVITWKVAWLDDDRLLDWQVNFPERQGRDIGGTMALTPVAFSWSTGAIDSFPTWVVPLDVVNGLYRPLGVRAVWAVDRAGEVWWSNDGEYRIEKRGLDGDVRMVIRVAGAEGHRVSAQERDSVIHWLDNLPPETAGKLTADDIPGARPIVAQMAAGHDGRVAVFPLLAGEEEGSLMDVFDATGRWLERVRLPVRLVPRPRPVFVDGELLGATRDSLGVDRVVLLSIPPALPGG